MFWIAFSLLLLLCLGSKYVLVEGAEAGAEVEEEAVWSVLEDARTIGSYGIADMTNAINVASGGMAGHGSDSRGVVQGGHDAHYWERAGCGDDAGVYASDSRGAGGSQTSSGGGGGGGGKSSESESESESQAPLCVRSGTHHQIWLQRTRTVLTEYPVLVTIFSKQASERANALEKARVGK